MRLLRSSSTISNDASVGESLDSWGDGEEISDSNDIDSCSDVDDDKDYGRERPSSHSNTATETTSAATAMDNATGEAGLLIYQSDGSTDLGYTYDAHLPQIHPNAFAPASMTNIEKLGGGGSGVAVFAGTMGPPFGDVVMKHGGYKDLDELFALATIAEELRKRSREAGTTPMSVCTQEAAMEVQQMLPEFKFVYISPHHIQIKNKELWSRLTKIIHVGSLLGVNLWRDSDGSTKGSNNSFGSNGKTKNPSFTTLDGEEIFLTPGMSIRMYERPGDKLSVVLDDKSRSRKPSLAFILPQDCIRFLRKSTVALTKCGEYETLRTVCRELMPIMEEHLFKFTLAQKRIGGHDAKTGNQWLYEGKLKGPILENLLTQFIHTVQNLLELTLPEENNGVVDTIREEVARIEEMDLKPDSLSRTADQFLGSAIIKNFHPEKGRMIFLRSICKQFRHQKLTLTAEERLPAKYLGDLSKQGARMSDIFLGASSEPPRILPENRFWHNLLSRALDQRSSMSLNALKRVWNAGLADAGIHNLFVDEKDVYYFDLGDPQLQSQPAFLTKFLMSFFHTLGMQEDGTDRKWVRRFEVKDGGKLDLTEETKVLLTEAYDCYEIALDRLIDELFDGDDALRWLLHQYVTLQLLSDASFCLQRWQTKGGGRPSDDNHNHGLERWLWRALWDLYIAYDINLECNWIRFDVSHPDFLETLRSSIEPDTLEDLSTRLSVTGSERGDDLLTPVEPQKRRPVIERQLSERALGLSLRDLTLNTYYRMESYGRTFGIEKNGTVTEGNTDDESNDDEDSDSDGSAIHPKVDRHGSDRLASIGLNIDS
jgi:hypothetical protein